MKTIFPSLSRTLHRAGPVALLGVVALFSTGCVMDGIGGFPIGYGNGYRNDRPYYGQYSQGYSSYNNSPYYRVSNRNSGYGNNGYYYNNNQRSYGNNNNNWRNNNSNNWESRRRNDNDNERRYHGGNDNNNRKSEKKGKDRNDKNRGGSFNGGQNIGRGAGA